MNAHVSAASIGSCNVEFDFIDAFMEYTEGIPSADVFRLWSGIATVAGCLERRVWVQTAQSVLYPNLYTLLIGAPGSGKSQALNHVEDIWRSTQRPQGGPAFFVAPNSVTKAALIDALSRADRKIIVPSGLVEYHTLLIAADEFGVLCPSHDLEFFSVLSYLYNNPKVYQEERRHGPHKSTDIVHPQLNLVAGAQPGFLMNMLPEEAWSQGFTSRIIMVFSSEHITADLFGKPGMDPVLRAKLLERASNMATRMGCFAWEEAAALEMQRWHRDKCAPEPEHTKLAHYNARRAIHTLKLCMVASMSRSTDLIITMEDLTRARDWLLAVEQRMPDLFKEMNSKTDRAVLDELHYYMWRLYMKDKKPIHKSRIVGFLGSKVAVDRIFKIMDVAEQMGMMVKNIGMDTFTPRHRNDFGLD
jgi:hypothetical protein